MSNISINSYPNQTPITTKPQIPYFGTVPGLTTGSLIVIYGRVPNGCRRFDFNLMVGSIITQQIKTSGDIAFHFNPRFDDQLVVRNSRQSGRWGPEEREPRVMPFTAGQDFETMILIEDKGFKVAVNGRHFVEFIHRIPISCVGVLSIEGTVQVDRIEYRREMRYLAPQMPVFLPSMVHSFVPILNPKLPFRQKFGEVLNSGFMVFISGKLSLSPDRFAIDFMTLSDNNSSEDIAFHIGVRIRDGLVVRNTRQKGDWGSEERQIGSHFPFYAGVNFDLIVRVESNQYMVAVNGQHFLEYKHRIPLPFVNGLAISGDINVHSIRYSTSA